MYYLGQQSGKIYTLPDATKTAITSCTSQRYSSCRAFSLYHRIKILTIVNVYHTAGPLDVNTIFWIWTEHLIDEHLHHHFGPVVPALYDIWHGNGFLLSAAPLAKTVSAFWNKTTSHKHINISHARQIIIQINVPLCYYREEFKA